MDNVPSCSQASWEFSLSQDTFLDNHYDPTFLSQDTEQQVPESPQPPRLANAGSSAAGPATLQTRSWQLQTLAPQQISVLGFLSLNDDHFGYDALLLVTTLANLCCNGSPVGFFFQHCRGLDLCWNGCRQKTSKIEAGLILSDPLKSAVQQTLGAAYMLQLQQQGPKLTKGVLFTMLELLYTMFHLVMFMMEAERPSADSVFYFTKGLLETLLRKKEDCFNFLYILVYVLEENQHVLQAKTELSRMWSRKWDQEMYKGLKDWIESEFVELVTRRNKWDDLLLPVLGGVVDRTRVLLKRAGLKNILSVSLGSVSYETNGRIRSCKVSIRQTFYETIFTEALLLCQSEPVTMGLLDSILVYVNSRAREAKKRRSEGCRKVSQALEWRRAETFVKAWLQKRENLPLLPARDHSQDPPLPQILEHWHLLQEMTPTQRLKYSQVLANTDNEAYAEATHKLVRVVAIKRLSGRWLSKWLNADPLDHYFACMANREHTLFQATGGYRPSYCLKPSFFERLMQQDSPLLSQKNVFNYMLVKRWTKKCPTGNIFNLRKLLFPINHSGCHWMLADIDFVAKYIVIWDSLYYNTKGYQEIIMRFLRCEYHDLYQMEMTQAELDEWDLPECTPYYPLKQPNMDDCGIMTILHADLLLTQQRHLCDQLQKAITNNYNTVIMRCRERLAAMLLENITVPQKLG